MDLLILCVAIVVLGSAAFVAGRARSMRLAGVGGLQALNSLPFYYGALTAFWCAVPAVLLICLWSIFDGYFIESIVQKTVPSDLLERTEGDFGLLLNQIRNVAAGYLERDAIDPALLPAVDRLNQLQQLNRWTLAAMAMSAGIVCSLAVSYTHLTLPTILLV